MSKITQQSPVLEKLTRISTVLDDLNEAIDNLDIRLAFYSLPEAKKEHKLVEEIEDPLSPLEKHLVELLNKIVCLEMKVKEINSRVR